MPSTAIMKAFSTPKGVLSFTMIETELDQGEYLIFFVKICRYNTA